MTASLKNFFSKKKSLKRSASNSIDEQLQKQTKQLATTLQILLLGAGGSGKSTVFKQMNRIYSDGETTDTAKNAANAKILHLIYKNIIADIHDLCKHTLTLRATAVTNMDLQFENTELEEIMVRIATEWNIVNTFELTDVLANDIHKLWNSAILQQVFNIRKKSHIMDNTPYFFANIHRYASPSYVPTFEDYVRLRDQTTGVHRNSFSVKLGQTQWQFHVTDVGGQRSERRKWIHVFADVNVVLFVMSLAAYDQVLYEDNSQSCLDEAFSLFEQTIHNKAFKKTDFIVFLNKTDVFEQKIANTSFMHYINGNFEPAVSSSSVLNHMSNGMSNDPHHSHGNRYANPHHSHGNHNDNCHNRGATNNASFTASVSGQMLFRKTTFPESEGHSAQAVVRWIRQQFEDIFLDLHGGKAKYEQIPTFKRRNCHFHVTCATDTQKIDNVVQSVQTQITLRTFSSASLI